MSSSKPLYVASVLGCLIGAITATAVWLAMLGFPTEGPSPAIKVDPSDTSQSAVDGESYALHTIEGQEIEHGIFPYIIRRIAVPSSITEQELRDVLLHNLEQIRKLDYGPMPEHRCAFTVLAYSEPSNARTFSGPTLATISLLRGQSRADVDIARETLAAIKEPAQLRFGLDDDVRRQIYSELVRANYECSDQADREFPDPGVRPLSDAGLQTLMKRRARFDELWQGRQDEISREYKLNRNQIEDIHFEGMRKHWPKPF